MTNQLTKSRDTFAASTPEQRITVNGRVWGAVQMGDKGPALVLLPGTLGRADIFWNQISTLQGRVRILALSYPDSGGIVAWSSDICAIMDHFGIETATVLGSSLGGYVAQYMAAVHAQRLDNLVAANTLHSVAILANRPPYNTDIAQTPIDELRQGFLGGMEAWRVEQPERAELIELLTLEITGRIPAPELRMRLIALKTGPELPAPNLPKERIFTVESDDDRLIPELVRNAVRARLNPAQSFRHPHGSHFPYVTHPTEYTEMLEGILNL